MYMFKSYKESMMITAATLFGYMDGVSTLVSETDFVLILIIGAVLLGLATMFINVFIIMAKYAYKESFRVVQKEQPKGRSGAPPERRKVYKFEFESESESEGAESDSQLGSDELGDSEESGNERKRFEFSSQQNVIRKRIRRKRQVRKQARVAEKDLFKYSPHWSIKIKEFFRNFKSHFSRKSLRRGLIKLKNYTVSFFIEKKDNNGAEYEALEAEFQEENQLFFSKQGGKGGAEEQGRLTRRVRHHEREHQLQPDPLPEEAQEVRPAVPGHPQDDPVARGHQPVPPVRRREQPRLGPLEEGRQHLALRLHPHLLLAAHLGLVPR